MLMGIEAIHLCSAASISLWVNVCVKIGAQLRKHFNRNANRFRKNWNFNFVSSEIVQRLPLIYTVSTWTENRFEMHFCAVQLFLFQWNAFSKEQNMIIAIHCTELWRERKMCWTIFLWCRSTGWRRAHVLLEMQWRICIFEIEMKHLRLQDFQVNLIKNAFHNRVKWFAPCNFLSSCCWFINICFFVNVFCFISTLPDR